MIDRSINECIELFRQKDYSHFSWFYEQTKRQIFFVVLPIVKDEEDAEDISQETYVRFIESLHLYKSGTNPFTFLSTIARNLAINLYNKNKRIINNEDIINSYPHYNKDDSANNVLELIKDLNDIEQEIIVMHIIDEYKFREIAKILDKPLSTVLVTYNRALKKIKKGGKYENTWF